MKTAAALVLAIASFALAGCPAEEKQQPAKPASASTAAASSAAPAATGGW